MHTRFESDLVTDGPCRYNKSVLTVFPYPVTCTVVQFGVGSIMALAMWTLGLHPKPQISKETVSCLPAAFTTPAVLLLPCALLAFGRRVPRMQQQTQKQLKPLEESSIRYEASL